MNTPEQRAYELLKWQSLGPLQKFDSSYPYLKTWKLYSDRALDATDKQDPYESSPELAAFRELERKGVFNQSDFYSPSKAADGYYTKRLQDLCRNRERREGDGIIENRPDGVGRAKPGVGSNASRSGQSERPRLKPRSPRCRP